MSTFPDLDYKIDITTADQPNAGTNSRVNFQLLGENGETDKEYLGDDGGQYFQPGQTDTFATRGKDVGKVTRQTLIRLRDILCDSFA